MQYPKHPLSRLALSLAAPAAAAAGIALAGCAHSDVPKPLDRIESAAEAAYDEALESEGKSVASKAETIERAWTDYRGHAAADGASSETVDGLDAAVRDLNAIAKRSRDPIVLARAANAVSHWVGALYGVYHPASPAVLAELDYLGREVALDGRAGDLDHAATSITKLEATWRAVRPRLTAAGATFTARKFDETIAGMHDAVTAKDASAVVFHAKKSLDEVDVMETVLAN